MSIRTLFAALLLLAFATACSTSDAAGPREDDDTRSTPAVSTSAPSGNQVIDCGADELGPGRQRNAASRDCLLQAFQSGTPATWKSTLWTIEGDPIENVVNVLGPDQVEVSVDRRADEFSAPEDRTIEVYQCRSITPETAGPMFRISGCNNAEGGEVLV